MKTDYQNLFRKLKGGEVGPLYLFAGAEEYLVEEAIRLIKERLVVRGEEELNFDMLFGSETSAQAILGSVETVGFFSERWLIVVQNADSLKDRKLLISYCKDPFKSTCLVLVDNKIDSKDELQSMLMLSKDAVVSHFWPLFPNQVPPWIRERARQKGKSISYECAEVLQELAGNSLRSLDQEIEKLVIYIGVRKNIEEEDVCAVVGPSNTENIFKLADAIGEKRLDKALNVFNQLKNKGDDVIAILGLLVRHFRILWQVKEMDEDGLAMLEMSKMTKIKPLFLKNYLQQIRNFSRDELKDAFRRMLKTDTEIKTGITEPRTALESLLISSK